MVLSRALLLLAGITVAGNTLAAPRKPAAPAARDANDQAMAAVESARQSHYVIRQAPVEGLRLDPPKLPDAMKTFESRILSLASAIASFK